MGCSPSHNGLVEILAKNAAKPLKRNKALLLPDHENNGITIPLSDNKNEEVKQKEGLQKGDNQSSQLEKRVSDGLAGLSQNGSFSDDQGKYEKLGSADDGMVNLTYQKRRTIRKHSSTGSEQEMSGTAQQDGNSRRNRKSKSQRLGKHSRRAKTNQAVVLEMEKKVDFPEELVKAHQDAYAFLNPNLSKYEAVISMANQAAQTHLIMQQMISFMALRFEDINQCLEEIAEDGEKLLKAVGSNLTWPFGKGDPAEQPDLLQQLLQYTVNKMQSLNGTVSSLTTNALQDSCSLLQSAINKFGERLKQKEHCDERLLKMIKSLEDSAAGSAQHHPLPNDSTLYSEDSGIGGDSESMRGYRSPDKMGRKSSIDSSGQISLATSNIETTLQMSPNIDKMSDLNLKSTSAQKENTNHSSGVRKSNTGVSEQTSLSSSPSMSSLGTTATLGEDSTVDPDSEESTTSDESSDESEGNKSLASQVTLTQRPLTSPAGMGPYKHPSKWLDNIENEEMTLKMKEAISEKIKFVPGKSISNVWTREELNPDLARPSTADGSNRRTSKQRRSRSAESLKSQSEDPTLLELQRTQKELGKKLEQLYSSAKTTDPNQNSNKSFSHAGCIISSNSSSTNKLKACLAKSFNILPSQERVAIRKIDANIAKDISNKPAIKVLQAPLNPQDAKKEEKSLVAERNSNSINASPRQSVRKLIQTFSPVEDATKKTTNVRTLGPLRCVRKFGVPVLPPTIPAYNGLQPLDNRTGEETSMDPNVCITTNILPTDSYISSKPYDAARDDIIESGAEDFENLPPPPLEILMDDSFNLLSANEQEKYTSFTCTMQPTMFQKIKTSVNIKNVLPSKNTTNICISKDRVCRNEDLINNGIRKYSLQPDQLPKSKELCMDLQNKHEMEQAATLYKQSHKIIHLQNPGDGEVVYHDKDNNEPCSGASMLKPKQYSPTLPRNVVLRKLSPTRAVPSSPPTDRKLTSPPTIRTIQKTNFPVQQPSSQVQKASNTTSTPRISSLPNEKTLGSPPSQRKLPSPPSQRKLSSPPQVGRQQSPPRQRSLPSPPQIRRQQSPPTQHRQPSPQVRRQQSPPTQHRQPSPPQIRRQQSPPNQHRQPSPPQVRRQQSPPSQHRQPSPPQIRKQQSPPSQRKLPSPPQIRNQQSPPSHRRLPSPPQIRREPSPPSFSTPSPPVSPSHTGLRRSSEDLQLSSKIIGNAQSIFCPSSSSLFEAKPPSSPGTSGSETVLNQVQSHVLRHTFSIRHCDDQQRRVAMSAANPQPFIRRSYSDRRPRVQLRLPTSISANAVSELALQQTRVEEFAQKDSEPATSQGLTDTRAAGQTAEQPKLCIVGHGLQKE